MNNSFYNFSVEIEDPVMGGTALRIMLNIIGALANVFFLTASIHQQKRQHSSVGFLIIQLALFWLFRCGVHYPVLNFVKIAEHHGWMISETYCSVFLTTAGCATLFGHCVEIFVAVNRLVAVWWPTRYRMINTKNVTAGLTCVSVGIALIGLLPLWGIGSRFARVKNNSTCVLVPTGPGKGYLMLMVTLGPILVAGVCYALLLWKIVVLLRKRRRRRLSVVPDRGHLSEETNSPMTKRRIRVSMALMVAFGCSLICTFPYNFLLVRYPRLLLNSLSLSFWTTTLLHTQYSVNPFIMIWISSDYGIVLGNMLRRKSKISPVK